MAGPLNLLSLDAKTKVTNSEATGGSGGVAYVSGSLTSGVQTINMVGTIIQNSFAKTGTGGVAKIIGKDALINVIASS
jgi:ABC-type sulfate transport system permease subunit